MSNCYSQITLAERRRLFEVKELKVPLGDIARLMGRHVGLDDLSRLPHTVGVKKRRQARCLVSASLDAGGTPPARRGPLLGGDQSR